VTVANHRGDPHQLRQRALVAPARYRSLEALGRGDNGVGKGAATQHVMLAAKL
jgi:hypothetical protein